MGDKVVTDIPRLSDCTLLELFLVQKCVLMFFIEDTSNDHKIACVTHFELLFLE